MVENKGSDKVFNYTVLAVMLLYAFVTLLPLWYVVANSFSSAQMVNKGAVYLFPREFTLENYKKILTNHDILIGFRNTLMYVAIGTVFQLFMQFTAAYPLSRKDLKGRSVISVYFSMTMFVSGGMIPTYIVVKSLGLLNTIWSMIIPGGVSIFNIIVIRTFMQSLPWELQEAAMLDGCGNIRMFVTIVLPLCRAVIAVMLLYSIVGYWNAYFNSLLYITKDELFPLQRVIQRILVANESSSSIGGDIGLSEQGLTSEVLKYVTIVVSSIPLIVIYPFFNKYFKTGLMIGGIKG
ncbi:MAG: carbohydrate ABC transporter permease [Candidatus Borkfalkiaceae bacterium]|nr:carbohydrate ABC transporter permease [Christensenellaceae bacterium]